MPGRPLFFPAVCRRKQTKLTGLPLSAIPSRARRDTKAHGNFGVAHSRRNGRVGPSLIHRRPRPTRPSRPRFLHARAVFTQFYPILKGNGQFIKLLLYPGVSPCRPTSYAGHRCFPLMPCWVTIGNAMWPKMERPDELLQQNRRHPHATDFDGNVIAVRNSDVVTSPPPP